MKKSVLLLSVSLLTLVVCRPLFAEESDASGASSRAANTPSADAATLENDGEGESRFNYGGEVNTHFQAEMNKPSNASAKGNAYNDTDLSLYGNYSSWLSLNSDMKLERNRNDNMNDYYPDRNTFFRSEGLTLRQMYATVRPVENVAVYGGKIHPNFGSAYEQTPGIFYNFGTDYEQDERIGVGAQYRLPDVGVIKNVRLSFEGYYLDTSFLSTSLISQPALDDPNADRLRKYTRGAFGPSNTGGLDSFTAALRGGKTEQGLTYQASLTREATDDPAGKTETGESVGASYNPGGDGIPLTSRIGVTPFLEYTHFDNFQNIDNLERHYVVGGLAFSEGRWGLNLAGGLRQSEGASQDTDHQENLTLTYELAEHLEIGGGINHTNIANVGSWGFGPSLSYTLAF